MKVFNRNQNSTYNFVDENNVVLGFEATETRGWYLIPAVSGIEGDRPGEVGGIIDLPGWSFSLKHRPIVLGGGRRIGFSIVNRQRERRHIFVYDKAAALEFYFISIFGPMFPDMPNQTKEI